MDHPFTTVLFDIDGTLTHDGWVDPALLGRLLALRRRGLRLALCTARSLLEVEDFITRELGAAVPPDGPFNGGLILEEGHVWLPPEAASLDHVAVLTSPAAMAEMGAFRRLFASAWRPAPDPALAAEGWGTLEGTDGPLVQEIPAIWRTLGSVTIWKREYGAEAHEHRGAADPLAAWALEAAAALGLQHTEIIAGVYGLRLLERGRDKGSALLDLGYDLARTVFIGDGANDLPVVRALRAAGGGVMAIANSIGPIKEAALAVAVRPASAGVVELLALLEARLDGAR